MSDGLDPQANANAPVGTAGAAGCVILLVDESSAMEARVADGTKSRADCMATAINSVLRQLGTSNLDVALIGYRGDAGAGPDVGSRWDGPLAGRVLVHTSQLADAPLKVEQRVRRIPGAGGIGVAREETVPFPVWYDPSLGEPVGPTAACALAGEVATAWLGTPNIAVKPPLVLSFLGEPLQGDALPAALGPIYALNSPAGPPMVFHAHLGASGGVPATLYPSADTHLPPGPICDLFQWTSFLPEPLADALRNAQVNVSPGARGLIYNARMGDLIRFLSLVNAYAEYQPPTAAPSAAAPVAEPAPTEAVTSTAVAASPAETVPLATEAAGLVVLLLDRSIGQPADEASTIAWERLLAHANDLLAEIAKRGKGRIDATLITCGADGQGQPDVEVGLPGAPEEKAIVPAAELSGVALRVDEIQEKVSNGIGGIIEFTRKKPIFCEQTPTEADAAATGMEAAAGLIADWRNRHPGGVAPVVLHLTCGRIDPNTLEQSAAATLPSPASSLQSPASGLPPPTLLYHLAVTPSPHRSLAYPGRPDGIEDPVLLKLWELSSPLLGAGTLAAERPAVTPDARGIVINGKFDLLLDGLLAAMPS